MVPTHEGAESPTILIADDEYLLRQMLQDVLEYEGYQVVTAPDGQAALNHLKRVSTPPQLILTDILMPGLGGFQLLKQTRKLLPMHIIPFVFISGQEATKIFDQATPEGVWGYLSKPFAIADLLKVVAHVVGQQV